MKLRNHWVRPAVAPTTTHTTRQSGQIAVVILLIMVVLMTIGLSVATRTTEELFLSQQESESARVFNAAEVGVEDALTQDFTGITSQQQEELPDAVTDTNIAYTITPSSTLETLVREGEHAYVDLTGQTGSELTIEWDQDVGCGAASLIASIYYDDNGTTRSRYEGLGPFDCTRNANDNFLVATGVNNDGLRHSYDLPVDSDASDDTIDLFVRIMAVYDDTNLRVYGDNLPIQYHTVRSTATNDIGDEQKTVQVQRTLKSAPTFMDFALYSGGTLVKN